MTISIVYHSVYGHTAKLAQAVAKGAQINEDTTVHLISVDDTQIKWDLLEKSDAIIFGSPTYNGTISSGLKKFFEDSTKAAWLEFKWRNKIAAGFTNSGAFSGDKLNSLITIALFAAQHGMIWTGLDLHPANEKNNVPTKNLNRLGSWLGSMAQSDDDSPEVTPGKDDLDTAQYLGKRVAEITKQFIR
ncbi:flavodoxin family protein [Apibacter raozihei]|uniref:flavodoxin family protein n=1 Tax=Apibacter raozihei TaxID=2500547 RepID=UPI000FE2B18C|nr:flavodoxin family protein [Apibacter raozihei]